MDTNACQRATKYKCHEILCVSSRVTITSKFLSCTYIYFAKIVKSYLEHSKTCKPSKAGSVEFLLKQNFFIIYRKGNKNNVAALPSDLCPHNLYQYHILLLK